MNFKLENNDYLILIPREINKKETSLIVTNHDTSCIGEVVVDYCVYEGAYAYKKGEIVMYDITKSQRYHIAGEEYIIVKSENIIAKVEV